MYRFKRIIVLSLFMILLLLAGCSIGKKKSVSDLCKQYASQYDVLSDRSQDVDSTVIRIIAPDFASLVKEIVTSGEMKNFDEKTLEKAIRNHPEVTKEYILTVEELSEDTIKEKLLDQVSYDLMVQAIMEVDYTEDSGGVQ